MLKNVDYNTMINAIKNNQLTVVENFLEKGLNPNGDPDTVDVTPLSRACMEGNLDIVKLLLKYGADPNYKKAKTERLPIFYTISQDIEILKILIKAGMNVNIVDEPNSHDAFNAIAIHRDDILQLLVDSGLDVNRFRDKQGLTLAQYARKQGYKSSYEIVTTGTKSTDMNKLVITDSTKLFKNLLNFINDNSENSIWWNETIVLPARSMEVITSAPYLGRYTRYLLSISEKAGISGPIILDVRDDESLNLTYNRFLANENKIRFIGYADYTSNNIKIPTYHFILENRN